MLVDIIPVLTALNSVSFTSLIMTNISWHMVHCKLKFAEEVILSQE